MPVQRRDYLSCLCEPFGADRGDGFLQRLHTVDQPRQFLAGDFVGRGIARADIGAIEAGKASLGETGIARPQGDQLRRKPLRMGAQESQLGVTTRKC